MRLLVILCATVRGLGRLPADAGIRGNASGSSRAAGSEPRNPTRRRIARADPRLGLRPSTNSDELTPSELRVAEFAASGLTNRKVAGTLFISPKTVEANLARIYRKLGIHSRAEPGQRMAQLKLGAAAE